VHAIKEYGRIGEALERFVRAEPSLPLLHSLEPAVAGANEPVGVTRVEKLEPCFAKPNRIASSQVGFTSTNHFLRALFRRANVVEHRCAKRLAHGESPEP
jgi:hypothetical protein